MGFYSILHSDIYRIFGCSERATITGHMIHLMTKLTNWHMRSAMTQISLGIRLVLSESSLCAQWIAKEPSFLHVDSEGCITKTYLYNFYPLKPHFYIVKRGFTGVYIIFLIFAQKIDCGYSLEPPRLGGSNEYPQSIFEQQ